MAVPGGALQASIQESLILGAASFLSVEASRALYTLQDNCLPHLLAITCSGIMCTRQLNVSAPALIRSPLLIDTLLQAVLQHPFTQQCPLVHRCMQGDLQRLRDSNGSTSPEDKQYTVEQRRLVRPTGALGSGPAIETGTSSSDTASTQQRAPSLPVRACGVESIQLTVQPCSNSQGDAGASQQLASAPAGCADHAASAAAAASHPCSSTRGSAWKRCRRQTPSSCKELMFVCDGDRNGVIYYIATDYGTKQWVNPVLSKAVDIKASSPPSRYTDPKVSRDCTGNRGT